MKDYGLDLHCQMILEEYQENLEVFQKIETIVREQIDKIIRENGLYVTAVESRIKTEKSLAGKLELKGKKYATLSDITDIVGARIVAFYTDEVDKISALLDKTFTIDHENSVDKRKMLSLDQFGYMSLHYICSIPPTLYSDPFHPEINGYRFEIQIRTALQHVWATMNHDTGYKSGVEVPLEYRRTLNRLAGLLELADEQFSNIRTEINNYRRQVQNLVADGNFDQVPLDVETYRSYLQLNPFKKLIDKIASINQAEIYEDSLVPFFDVLAKLHFKTLGDIEKLKKDCSEAAYQLALHQLAGTDLDIVALSVALQNLCIIYVLKKGGGEGGLKHIYDLFYGESDYNVSRAKHTIEIIHEFEILK